MITFKEQATLGRNSQILVKKKARIPRTHSHYKEGADNLVWITKGRIEKSPLGYFQYFEPETNELNPSFKADSLDELKAKIIKHLSE